MNVNRESLVQRLQTLNVTQQSIEGTSKWCLFYVKDAKSVVNIWYEEFGRASDRRVAFLYLANQILQVRAALVNSRAEASPHHTSAHPRARLPCTPGCEACAGTEGEWRSPDFIQPSD